MKRFQKPPFLCVHIDQMRFQKPPFLWISTFDSVFENLRFCGVFVRISVNTFTKTEVFLSVFVQKRSSVNGALDCVHTMPEQFENGQKFAGKKLVARL